MSAVLPEPAVRFVLPRAAEATAPPEARGLARDEVRLLVARPDGVEHQRFRDLPDLLAPGDLVVVNTSATLPAAVDARLRGRTQAVHVSGALDDGTWAVEVRLPDGSGPDLDVGPGDLLDLPDGLVLRLDVAWPDPAAERSRLWRAVPSRPVTPGDVLAAHGRPVAYAYLAGRVPLRDVQTVFADEPGSAEMASAGRPFTAELVVRLAVRGVAVAPLVLHAGVSSPELHEPPLPERFTVPASTARLVEATRTAGGRVVAVGTTVTRALETAAGPDGTVRAGERLDRPRPVRRPPGPRRHRARHRPARPGGQPPAAARGGGGRRPRPAGVRRRAGGRLPLARVRRLVPVPALTRGGPL